MQMQGSSGKQHNLQLQAASPELMAAGRMARLKATRSETLDQAALVNHEQHQCHGKPHASRKCQRRAKLFEECTSALCATPGTGCG